MKIKLIEKWEFFAKKLIFFLIQELKERDKNEKNKKVDAQNENIHRDFF